MKRVTISEEMKQRTIARLRSDCDKRAIAHFRELHTEWAGWFGEGVLEAAALEGVKDARQSGNDSVGGILDYLTMVYMMGHQFTSDPQYQSWVGPWIKHSKDTGERLKTEHLAREALELIPKFYLSVADWLKALDAAEERVKKAPDLTQRFTEPVAKEATTTFLNSVWPSRMEHLSEEELSALMHAMNPPFGAMNLKTPELFAVGMLFALRFGSGFLWDPRYPRFAELAGREDLIGQEWGLSMIEVAREFARYPQKRSFE